MKLTADNIQAHLEKGLSSVYFISGDDALLVGEAADAVRSTARAQGFDERESHSADGRFDWDTLLGGLDNLSLFASRKIIEVRLLTGKPGRSGAAALVGLAENPPADTLFLITSPRLDSSAARSKWAKTLEQKAVRVDIPALTPDQLPGWLQRRFAAVGLQAEQEAIELLAARVEGNLLAAHQEIGKLELLADGGPVTAQLVEQSVADGARFDVFRLADAAIALDVTRALRVLAGLRRDGTAPALALWSLGREAATLVNLWAQIDAGAAPGQAMQAARIWRSRQGLYGRALRAHDEQSIRRLAHLASRADRVVKGAARGQPWGVLAELVMSVASPGHKKVVHA